MNSVRVLIVDDEQDFATAIAERLSKRGFHASSVFSGQDALRAVKETEYDAVVLDLKMPGMDGLQTLQEIRKIDPAVQILVLTGHGTVSAGIGGMQLGAADFLQKPLAIEALSTSIQAAAEQSHAKRSQKQSKNENNAEL
jgi:DNA-binding NtrC family response regulator